MAGPPFGDPSKGGRDGQSERERQVQVYVFHLRPSSHQKLPPLISSCWNRHKNLTHVCIPLSIPTASYQSLGGSVDDAWSLYIYGVL